MNEEQYMLRAVELAERSVGKVEPNPPVGAVIVRDGAIIGEGFHERFGGPHAEINALHDAFKKGKDVRGATIYVSLEPCCHFGKTPPYASNRPGNNWLRISHFERQEGPGLSASGPRQVTVTWHFPTTGDGSRVNFPGKGYTS